MAPGGRAARGAGGFHENDREAAVLQHNARKLRTTAALVVSVMLVGSAIVTALRIPAAQFQPGGAANGRAWPTSPHENLGGGFGTVYDIATIGILWFAGSSAMTGLLNIVPRYLSRYGMAPDWARATRG